MSFELSRTFDGSEIIECGIVIWKPNNFLKSAKAAANEKIILRAPKNDSLLAVQGSWEPSSFLLNPQTGAIRIGSNWILIGDVDAASQFPVEKEHAVAFPYETKQVYVSGHVGLHLHIESTGEGFTMAFPNFELADVAFDAVNRLSYEQLSHLVFEDHDSSDEDENDTDEESQQSEEHQHHSSVQLPKKLLKRKNSGIDYKALAREAKRRKKEEAQRKKEEKAGEDEFDENFVAESGTELMERGKTLNLNDFTTHFLEGGGMGSLAGENAANGGENKGPTGPPNNGVIRCRKETGSLSSWIARMEEGDNEHIYFLKLSKALVKAPLNKIIRASPPKIAQYFGPVVPLRFDSITIRSESFRSEFILEEVYTNSAGDKRIHRLMCVFHSLEERIRWEDWLQSHGVQKKAIDPDLSDKKKKKKGENEEEGEEKDAETKKKNSVDTTMQLVLECFRLDEVWDKPKPLRRSDARARGGAPKQFQKFKPKFQTNDGEEIPEYIEEDDEEFEEDEEDDFDDNDDEYEDDGVMQLPFVADTPRIMENQESFVASGPAKSPRNRGLDTLAFDNFSFTSGHSVTASSRSRELAAFANGSLTSPKSVSAAGSHPTTPRSGSKKRKNNQNNNQNTVVEKSPEELQSEQEAVERCPWFAGYQPQKKNKWEELSQTLRKESSAGSGFFNAVKMLKAKSKVSAEDDAGTAHLAKDDSKPQSPTSSKLSAILRARQLKKAMEMLEEAKRKEAAGEERTKEEQAALDNTRNSPEVTAVVDLSKVEEEADKEAQEKERQDLSQVASSSGFSPSASPITRDPSQSQYRHQNNMSADKYQNDEVIIPLGHHSRTGKVQINNNNNNNNNTPQQQHQQHEDPQNLITSPYQQQHQSGISLFGGPLPSKFPKINLRSEGYVDDNEINSAILKNKNNSIHNNTSSVSGTSTAHSPAAEESRNFAFGYRQKNEVDPNHTAASPFDSPKGTIMGDYSFAHDKKKKGRNNTTATIETSSDSDDEVSQRFARARAMRAVSQLGEEFVGVGFTSPNSAIDASSLYSPSSQVRASRSTTIGGRLLNADNNNNNNNHTKSSPLASHLSPTCPLCGADRNVSAICKKTGRLHAKTSSSAAAVNSSSRLY